MKESPCEKTINTFLELDRDEHLGLKTTIHLLTCKKCRTVVRLCTLAQRSSARPLRIPETITNDCVSQIVQKANPTIELLKDSSVKSISMNRWILSGISLIIAIFIFSIFNRNTAGSELQITIYLCFSAFICAYCAFFVGSNLDFFVKQIDKNFRSNSKK